MRHVRHAKSSCKTTAQFESEAEGNTGGGGGRGGDGGGKGGGGGRDGGGGEGEGGGGDGDGGGGSLGSTAVLHPHAIARASFGLEKTFPA